MTREELTLRLKEAGETLLCLPYSGHSTRMRTNVWPTLVEASETFALQARERPVTTPNEKTLADYGRILIALHKRGYTPARGYSMSQADDQFGKGTITVQAVCLPPEVEAKPGGWQWRSVIFSPHEVGAIVGMVCGGLLAHLIFLFWTR